MILYTYSKCHSRNYINEHQSEVPVPKIYAICNDTSILGTTFYIMEYVEGIIYKNPLLPNCTNEQRCAIYNAVASVLASIHNIRVEGTELMSLGSPTGYASRYTCVF